jgi:hypothetical protein
VGREGFEPSKSKQQIYSLSHLATLVSPRQYHVKKRADGGIRTPDQLITNQLLWPTELHRQYLVILYFKRTSTLFAAKNQHTPLKKDCKFRKHLWSNKSFSPFFQKKTRIPFFEAANLIKCLNLQGFNYFNYSILHPFHQIC